MDSPFSPETDIMNTPQLGDWARFGDVYEVQRLLNEGVDPDVEDEFGYTPMKRAIEKGHEDVAKLLIKAGADIHSFIFPCNRTVLECASRLGWMDIVKHLLKVGVDLNKMAPLGTTPLMMAVEGYQLEIAELLIKSGADIHRCNHLGWTALHFAACTKSLPIVQCLLNNGAVLDKKTSSGETPLMFAVENSTRKIVELFVELGADTASRDDIGYTLLHYARRSIDMMQYLVNKGVAIDVKDSKGCTPLHFVAQVRKKDTADYLLEAGADCNLEDNLGTSPFNIFVREKKHVETIKLCIEKGAYVNSRDYNILLADPALKENILENAELCSRAVINKFNNKYLPLLYKGLTSTQKLPNIDKMKNTYGPTLAREVELAVTREIQKNNFYNLSKMDLLPLGLLAVESYVEKSRLTFNQTSQSESKNRKRLNKDDIQEHPSKRMCN